MNYKVIIPPTEEPLTLDETKLHLRVDNMDEDDYISALITAAREQVEQITGRALLLQIIQQKYTDFPRKSKEDYPAIRLLKSPVAEVSSITYKVEELVDEVLTIVDAEMEAEDYIITSTEPAYIVPNVGTDFPSTNCEIENVIVEYIAGYPTAADVPQSIKFAMLLLIGDLYENRQDGIRNLPRASQALLNPYRTNKY